MIFTSARDTAGASDRIHTWTGEHFTNLYAADMGSEGTLTSAERFGGKLNSRFHESTPVFTKDGKTVYFTRNNFLSKRGKNKAGTTLLKLYKATLEGDEWVNITELPFNSDEYSVAHPALSGDEKTLYFASDMPGTLGRSDIFKVIVLGNNSYSKPENLGALINTEGRETFPFISGLNELYFASDGHPGLGGLDIFVSRPEKDMTYREVVNVGEPLNSSKDDFSFLIDTNTSIGFVTSNRENGVGGDDIYRFTEIEKLKPPCEQLLSGILTDRLTGLPLANAKITLSDGNFNKLREVVTDENGRYDFGQVDCNAKYYLKAEKEGYNVIEMPVITTGESGKTEVPIEVDMIKQKITTGSNLATVFKIKEIYFDLDKSFIRRDAAIELAKILDVLEQYPAMELDIRSHTDCCQTYSYNMKLSEKRAKSTIAWLVSKGIDKARLTGRGYGESQLVNDCACEPTNRSECSEEEHQLNRRSEFIIKKM